MKLRKSELQNADRSSELSAGKQLCFALYSATNRMARMNKPFLDPLGLTFPQYLVLLELFTATPQTVGSIGRKLGMDAGTITPLLKRLEAAGTVTRTRDPRDERKVLIDLTSRGRALREPVLAIDGQIRSACQLSEEEMGALRETLDAFAWPARTASA